MENDVAGIIRQALFDGQILQEAKYINLSLHYLEQVVIALQERSMGGVLTSLGTETPLTN